MDTDLGAKIIKELNEVATVAVDMTGTGNANTSQIVVDTMKLREVMCGYDYLREVVHKTWSNLPPSPVPEKTHVVVWLIICNDYGINHSTIRWPGSSPNTYVHLWSIMDRIKTSLTNIDANWLVGSRDCVEYCTTTGMNKPMDQYMYGSEHITPDPIEAMEMNPELLTYEHVGMDFDSFYDFHMSTITPRQTEVFNVSMLNLSKEMREVYLNRPS